MNEKKIIESIQIAEEIAKEICTQEPSSLSVADKWKKESPQIYEELMSQQHLEEEMKFHDSIDVDKSLASLNRRMSNRSHRRLFLQISSMAASVLIIVGTALWWMTEDKEPVKQELVADWTEMLPGNEKSTLTTTDNQTIVLETGQSAVKGNKLVAHIEGGKEKLSVDVDKVPGYNRLAVPAGGQYELVLEDGTEVKINAASELLFPAHFSNPRIVRLTGEGLFKVKADKENPFIVQLGDLQVKVTGTTFNIKSYTDEKELSVALIEGEVQIYKMHKELVKLSPGQLFTYNKETETYTVENTDLTSITSWVEDMFVFRKEPIKNIMKILSRWYNINISVSKEVENVRYTGVLMSKKPLKETLDLLKRTDELDFHYEEGKKVEVEEKRK